MVRNAAVYARISSDPEGDRLGVTRQREDCEALAARKGWPVREAYIDDDRSAYSGKPRPEYRRLLADIASHQVDALVAYNLDRLHRQPRELEAFFDVVDKAGLTNLATVEGDINLGSDDGRFHARILGAVARKSSDDLSRRITRKNQERAMKGLPTGGGARPFGYRPDRVTTDPGEAALVREAASRVLAGEAVRVIAGHWNDRGILTTMGKAWTIETLRRMLESPRLSGQREYHGEIVAKGQWEAILTPDDTTRLRAVLAERRHDRQRPVRRYLLSGLLRCSLCDARLISRPTASGTGRYVCATGISQSGCGRIAINAAPVDDFVSRLILERLNAPDLGALLAGNAAADTLSAAEQASLAHDQDTLDGLARDFGEGRFGRSEWFAARAPIETRIAETRKKISRLSRTAAIDAYVGHADDLAAAWPDMSLNQQRSIVSALMDRAVVGRAVPGRNTFDPGRIEALWRDA